MTIKYQSYVFIPFHHLCIHWLYHNDDSFVASFYVHMHRHSFIHWAVLFHWNISQATSEWLLPRAACC